MTHTSARTWQYLGLIVIALAMGAGYWYFSARAGVKQGAPLGGPAPSNLVGYWSFDGDDISGTTAYDRSGSGNNGTLVGGPAKTNGKLGQAIVLNGSTQDMTLGNAPVTAPGLTITAWIKPTLSNSGVAVSVLNTTNQWNGFYLSFGSDQAVCSTVSNNSFYGSTINGNVGEWQFVACVVSSTTSRTVYMNGVPGTPNTTSATPASTPNALTIGAARHDSSTDNYFNGSIDEVRIYNTALTASQIYDLYKLGGETVGASNPTRDSLNEGLAGYWPLDNGSGTTATDLSTNGNNGTLTNNPTWGTGQIGGAVTFDGTNDYITAAHSTALNFNYNENFSLALWVKIPATQNTVGFGANEILTKWVNTGPYPYYIAILNQNFGTVGDRGKISFARYDGTNNPYVRSAAAINDNTWHHINLIKQGSILKLYVDGALSNTATDTTTTTTTNAASLYIGEESGTAYPFTGSLDDIRIYNRALTAEEVTRLYKTTTPSNPDTRLKGYWSFDGDSISGTTARDLSGSGNNGTLTNGPTGAYGIRGQALSFFPNRTDTDAYVTMGDPASEVLDFGSGDFTASFWMNSYGYNNQSSSGNIALIKKVIDTGGSAGYAFFYDNTNAMSFRIGNGTTDFNMISSAGITSDHQWHHYTGVRSGSTANLYVDGVLVSSASGLSGSTSNSVAFAVGSDTTIWRNVDGSIDEVRIYNAALSASEIWNLYQEGGVKVNQSQSNNGDSLNDGLAGYWKLDDASGTTATDASGNSNNGTLTNGPTWGTGQIGGATTFDGTDDYLATASFTNSFSNGTYSYWAYFPNVAQTQYARTITTGPFNTGPSVGISHELNPAGQGNNKLKICHWGICNGSMTITVNLDQWNLITHTIDSNNNAVVYLNGVQVAQSNSATRGTGSSVFTMGKGDNAAFKGSLDEVRIYNRVLAADEVTRLYKTTSPTNPETGLVGYWSFNGKDIAGTTAYDRSGKGNNGTLTNGPTKTFGKIGQALSFDGSDDYVNVANESNFDFERTNSFSSCAWFNITTTAPLAQAIVTKLAGDVTGGWDLSIVGDKMEAYIQNTYPTNTIGVKTTTAVSINTWNYGCFTYDGSSTAAGVTLYLNGSSQSKTTDYDSLSASILNNNAVGIGERTTGGGSKWPLSGKIDEVRVYNRVLSATEITNLYNFGR